MSSYYTTLTWVDGTSPYLNATNLNSHESAISSRPVGEIGFASVSADQTGISTETNLTGLSVTTPALPSGGRKLKVTVSVTMDSGAASAEAFFLRIKESTTTLNQARGELTTAGQDTRVELNWRIAATSGAHTYYASLELAAGTGPLNLRAAGVNPSFILVEDMGV